MRTQNLVILVLTLIYLSGCVTANKGDLFTCTPEVATSLAAGLYRQRADKLETEEDCKNDNEILHVAGETDYCRVGCQTGCVCKPGYVYVRKFGCVTLEESELTCNKSEEIVCGKKECEKICELDDDPLCTLNFFDCGHSYQCFCMKGYIRTTEGKCIPESACPMGLYNYPIKKDLVG